MLEVLGVGVGFRSGCTQIRFAEAMGVFRSLFYSKLVIVGVYVCCSIGIVLCSRGRGVRGSLLNPPCLGLSRGKTDLVVVAVQGACKLSYYSAKA
jgi:hypothetical protein